MAAAQQKRWAAKQPTTAVPQLKGKRKMSPAAKALMSAKLKASWAKRKAAKKYHGPAPDAAATSPPEVSQQNNPAFVPWCLMLAVARCSRRMSFTVTRNLERLPSYPMLCELAVHRLRGRYQELFRAEVRQTLSDPAQVEQEMRALFSAFAE